MGINFSFSKTKVAVVLFFGIFLITGLAITKDYGSHWDEFTLYTFGDYWYHYTKDVITNGTSHVTEGKQDWVDILHGPAIEMSIAFGADKLGLKDSRRIFIFRHYCVWLIFFIGVIFFYLLCKLHFKNENLALLGCLFLVLQPRIFANSFYDSLDIAMLSFYIIGLYTLARYLRLKTMTMLVLHALACAVLIDIRLIGAMMPLISGIVLLWDAIATRHDKRKALQGIRHIVVFSLLLPFFVILFWPYLWGDPLARILEVIKMTPRIPFHTDVLFLGQYIDSQKMPWHYIPVWIAISTPVLYSLFFIAGCLITTATSVRKNLLSGTRTKNYIIFLGAFFLPILIVIMFHSTLYDSWRHLFFVYPAFVLVALMGVEGCFGLIAAHCVGRVLLAARAALILMIIGSFSFTVSFMIKNHPYQNVYFNFLAGKNMRVVKDRFDLDYWGLSYRKALEYIAKNDKRASIKVYDSNIWGPMGNNIRLLPITDRNRMIWSGLDDADYFLTNYRYHKQDYPYPNECFSISVGNAKIMSVFKLKD